MFFNGRRWVSLVRGCVGRAVRGRRSRRSGTAWRLERLENRIVPAVITVTSAAVNLTVDGQVTLREAIQAAETDTGVDGSTAGSGADTIVFAAELAGQTITLNGTHLDINSALTINGLGASQLTISGHAENHSRIFRIIGGNTVTISGLTLSNGRELLVEDGGAIHNAGILTINNCTVFGNSVSDSSSHGGGVFNDRYGTLIINNSTISENSAAIGGGVSNYGTLTISNTTISENSAPSGGGVFNNDTLTINNSTISENSAAFGGGVLNFGTLTINNSAISDNSTTEEGGGIHNVGTLMINGGTISENTDSGDSFYGGGGISHRGGTLTINHATISGNTATVVGGGIYSDATLTINNSLISENSANGSGGIYSGSTLTINNSTISGNSAVYDGGGIGVGAGLTTINNSTISGNSAVYNGGGIFNPGGATVNLRSTIIANNNALDASDDLYGAFRAEFSLIERRPGFTVVETVRGSNRYRVDPLLGPLAENGGPTLTHALLPGSPAINRGSNPVPQSFDARGLGYVRAVGRTDIGAFEVQQKGSYLVPDLINPLNRAVIVVGSPLNDTISVALSGTGATQKYHVTFNGRIQKLPAANVFRIVVRGNDGNDTITLASSVLIGGLLDGGTGDDSLTGSSGNDLLLGGEGDDRLLGLGGRDVLIGGDGHDSLTGGNGDDLLIGGATDYDQSPIALLAIATEWTSASDYAPRTKNLREGLNAVPPLNVSTIFDGFYDELTADTGATGGLELLFHDILDQLTGVTVATEQAVLVQ